MSFPVTVGLSYGDEKKTYSNAHGRALGTRAVLPDGRVFRWALNGGVALAAGNCVQAFVPGGSLNLAMVPSTSAAVGSTQAWDSAAGNIPAGSFQIDAVMGSTGPHTANEFNDGYAIIETTPGAGVYKITGDGDLTATTTTNLPIAVKLEDPLTVALTTVSKVGFVPNPYSSVIASIGTSTNRVMGVVPGVASDAVAINQYFWLQTWGPCAVAYNTGAGTAIAGGPIYPDSSIAGAVQGMTSGAATTVHTELLRRKPVIGVCYAAITDDTDKILVDLAISA